MIPIYDFCFQDFQPLQTANARIGDLQELAKCEDPFVLFDAEKRWSAVVIPERVRWAIVRFGFEASEAAADVGMVDLLRGGQLIVRANQPSSRVARLAMTQSAPCVIASDDLDRPVGVFIPSRVAEHLPHTHLLRVESTADLRATVDSMAGLGLLTEAIRAIEREHLHFHSEGINLHGGAPYVCGGDDEDGPHHVNDCPCVHHPGAACSRRALRS